MTMLVIPVKSVKGWGSQFWGKFMRRQLEARRLMKLKTLDEFMDHLEEIQHPYFQTYLGYVEAGRPIHQSLIDYLHLDFKGKKVLDIGPGLGAFLDLAREAGAESTEFVDYDPIFWRYLKFRGHKGWVSNYKRSPGFFPLTLLNKRRYDVVLSRGAINGDEYNALFDAPQRNMVPYPRWLKQVDSMVAPDGIVIITPTYRSENPKWTCTDPDEFRSSPFYETMMDFGYEVLPIIEGYGDESLFPFTFYKRQGGIEIESLPPISI